MRCPSPIRALTLLAWVALLTSALAGCGRRGQLEPAPDPSAQATAATGDSASPIGRRPKRVPIQAPHQSFILDPLL